MLDPKDVAVVHLDPDTGRWFAACVAGKWHYRADALTRQQEFLASGGDMKRVTVMTASATSEKETPLPNPFQQHDAGSIGMRHEVENGQQFIDLARRKAGTDQTTTDRIDVRDVRR